MKRVLIPIDSQDPNSWALALAYAKKFNEGLQPSANVILLVHTKNQINSTVLSSHIGSKDAKMLNKGNSLRLPFGAQLHLKTLKTLGSILSNAIIIVFFADEQLLQIVDDQKNLVGVIVVPNHLDSAKQWAARWTPIVHGMTDKPATKLIADPVVVNALLSITRMINLSTGLVNSNDKNVADDILRILRSKGHPIETDAVLSWAIQNGWRSSDANDLAILAERIWALKSAPNLSRIHNWADRYASWAQ